MQSRLCVPFQRMMMMVIASTDVKADFCWIPFTLLMALHELVGVAIASAAEAATAAEGEASTAAKERVAQSVRSLLLHVAQQDLGDEERRIADGMLCASGNPKALKGGLLKALKLCETHRGFLGLPALMEETRKLLAAAPAKGVSSYLEEALCADIDACQDPRALLAVAEVHQFMTGAGRLKKELGGVDLPAPHKKSCRTVANRATKAFGELERRQRLASMQQHQAQKPKVYEMEKDFRLEEREETERKEATLSMGMNEMFDKAMQIKNEKATRAMASRS